VPDADRLDESQMRAIAREFNQSETTFLLRPQLSGATCRLRSFTPAGAQVGGAGHNALGAWLWLAAAGRLPDEESRYGQEIAGEVLPVEIIRDPDRPVVVSMDQAPPRFDEPLTDRAALVAALGLEQADLDAAEPARVASTVPLI
jgi:trans-2,3-dihydro-3-hydroxyanthranilate isomerase